MIEIDIDLPVGDPGGMRTKAARIGVECSGLVAAAAAIEEMSAAMVYQCVAGNRFREKVVTRRRQLDLVVHQLQSLQHEILREASRLEATQDAMGRLVRAVEAGAAGAAAEPAALRRELSRLVEEL